ncbi:phage/plasmid primase, P4 family [Eleftheria terrae]|uniref:phage/plasmid primase, P4 family n=1 Tax=Eleftheria terrae TaxID=1597781 RepID=UPI00263B0AD0|nr:phage/plasmid primase, P4 family [Eleftheria terrae]WKB50800.1 phage/plasmid primase, P4 family [Eleftheria terrae]
MLDFNDYGTPVHHQLDAQRDEIRAALLARLESVLAIMFPAGKKRGGKLLIGDVLGSPGDSLEIVLEGEKAGLWTDRANGSGGDVFSIIAAHYGLDVQRDFQAVLQKACDLLGRAPVQPAAKPPRKQPVDELGPATARWDYLDAAGQRIASVYRYDPPGGKKEFRPWDVRRKKATAPNPRPLYNQPGISTADLVVLTEGEKCADTLIRLGICATTAMNGANAPIEKTDWSPLAGKTVLIWPDKDKPGWQYAENAAQAILRAGATSCAILYPPEDTPEGWDAADAAAEGFDVQGFITARRGMPVTLLAEPASAQELLEGVDWNTEDGLATAFTRHYAADWRYCAAWGKWMVWTGTRWNEDEVKYVLHLARGIGQSAATVADSPRQRARLASSSTFAAIEKIARSEPRHASRASEWDRDLWALNTPGGVVQLRDASLRAHARGDQMTKITTAAPHGECPNWLAFLDSSTGGDVELQRYLARMVGYCLTGSTQEHALFFLYGTGGNGKSVFINTIASILGDYATHAPMDTFMESRSDRHPTDMAGLRGARLVCSVETEQGRRWAESKVKALTGGDPISARFMRQDFFQFTPQFKLIVAGNHRPSMRNIDEAMKRRLHLVPFTVTIPAERRDKWLPEKLLAERGGILAWAIKGCLEWLQQGLNPPQSVVAATHEYFEAEDALGRHIAERCVLAPNAKALTIELYADFKQWAEANGEFVMSQRRFSDALIARRIERWRNSAGVRGFVGIGLKVPSAALKTPLPYKDD